MPTSMDGKTCIVTGAAGGLGKKIAETLLEARGNVVIVGTLIDCFFGLKDINNDRLEEASKELSTQGSVLAIQADITSSDSIQKLFDEAISKFGRVDALVNNAGIMDHFEPAGDTPQELWDRVLAVNLTAPFMLTKAAINHLLSRENPKGAIVNVGSIGGTQGGRAGVSYTVSKHGLIGLTKNTAAVYGKKGIRCNAILPGAMQTNIGDSVGQNPHQEGLEISRKTFAVEPGLCDLQDVANLCVYLASDDAIIANGACVPADLGWAAF
ncbi:MAG: hypothetical protein M1820_004719 [Bogoriella megaspora]|nr:MAG: hypothetical protein M1820_004719 [Bogoriella megaspora]